MKLITTLMACAISSTLMLSAQEFNSIPAAEKHLIFDENFNDNLNGWAEKSNELPYFFQGAIEKGAYKIIAERETNVYNQPQNINLLGEWEAETDVWLSTGDKTTGHGGLLFGNITKGFCNSFLINHFGQYCIQQAIDTVATIKQTWTDIPASAAYDQSKYTRLTLRKLKDKFYFYINRKLIYQCDAWPMSAAIFGIRTGAGQQTWVDRISVYHIERCVPDIEPIIEMDGLFCSYIHASAALSRKESALHPSYTYLGDELGEIGLRLCNKWGKDARFTLKITCSGLMEESTLSGALDKPDHVYELFPYLEYKLETLNQYRSPELAIVNFQLTVNNKVVFDRNVTTTIYGFGHLPTYFHHRRGNAPRLLNETLAGSVNEYHPVINNHVIPMLEGEWMANQDNTTKAASIWYAFQKAGIRYANFTISDVTPHTAFQEYKTHESIWKDKSGNCLDLSLFYSACLIKCGVLPYIVIFPSHCMVGYQENGQLSDQLFLVEITGIGDKRNERELKKDPIFQQNRQYIEDKKKNLPEGQFESFGRFITHIVPTDMQTIQANGGTVVSIKEMRQLGVKPNNFK